jgi:hypothetical protein
LYRVLVWTGGRVEEIEERPETEEGREACNKIFRGSQLPAALCRGATVVKRNAKGEARAVAFKTFAAGDVAAPPALRPTAPAVRPAAPTQPAAPEPVTPRPVEPAAAPVVPTTTAEEHAPVKKRVDTVPVCSKCGQEPRARTTSRTHPGTETYGEKCRKAALDRDRHAAMRDAKRAAKAAGAAPQKPAKKAPPPVAAPAASLADGLARVQRHAAAIARLGGIDAAEQLAALVADAGGVAEVAAALTTLRSLA